jgi:hypothetical protein
MNVTQINTALLSLSETDLLTVHAEVVALIKHKQRARQVQVAATFNLKEVVEFTNSRSGHIVRGVIEKINQKSIRVRTETGLWNVSPSLLSKVA